MFISIQIRYCEPFVTKEPSFVSWIAVCNTVAMLLGHKTRGRACAGASTIIKKDRIGDGILSNGYVSLSTLFGVACRLPSMFVALVFFF